MRFATIALALLLAGQPAADAEAPGTGPSGARCALGSATDRSYAQTPAAADLQWGSIVAGPLPASGTLTCTVQVNAVHHDDPDTLVESFIDTSGVIADARNGITYVMEPLDQVYLCASFAPTSGSTVYWAADTESWTTDANARCTPAIHVQTTPAVTTLGELCPLCAALVKSTNLSDWRAVVAVG